MSRLRTGVRTLADLALSPDDLLTRFDDLGQRLAREGPPGARDTGGATCLYAVDDPVARRCTMAGAGHPPPVLVRPGGGAEVVQVCPGPPLGVGGPPFETTTLDLGPGSVLALYTKGLRRSGGRGLDERTRLLVGELDARFREEGSLESTGRAVAAELRGRPPGDDLALPLACADARTRGRPARRPGLDALAFTIEPVVSELVTDAVRYAGGPVGLRLIRGGHRPPEPHPCSLDDRRQCRPRQGCVFDAAPCPPQVETFVVPGRTREHRPAGGTRSWSAAPSGWR